MKGLPVGRTPIQFEGDYIAVSQEEYKRRARDPRFDYAHRVEYAAMGWANQIGHAEFPTGKLNEVLADKNGKSLSVNALNNHIRRAKGWGFVEPESNRRTRPAKSTACIRRSAGAHRAVRRVGGSGEMHALRVDRGRRCTRDL
jgi:hypothetical protein